MLVRDMYNALGLLVSAVAGALCCCQPVSVISSGPIEAVQKDVGALVGGTCIGILLWVLVFRSSRPKVEATV